MHDLVYRNAHTCCSRYSSHACPLIGRCASSLSFPQHTIRNARDNLGVPCFIQPADICKPNKNLNLAFCAQIFNTNPGLTVSKDELEEVAAAGIMDDDVGDTREEVRFV